MLELRVAEQLMAEAEQSAAADDFQTADELLKNAARIQEAELGPLHPDLANTLNNLAIVEERIGRLDEAETFYRRAAAIASASLPIDHPMIAASRENLEAFCRARGVPLDIPDVMPLAAPDAQPESDAVPDIDAVPETDAVPESDAPKAMEAAPEPAPTATVAADAVATLEAPAVVEAEPVAKAPPPPLLPSPPPVLSRPRPSPSVPRAPAPRQDTRASSGTGALGSTRTIGWVAIAAVAVTVLFLVGQLWSARNAPAPAAAPTTPPATEPARQAATESPPAPTPVPASSSSDVFALASVDLCRTFSTSGADWRCDPAGDRVAPGRLVLYTRVKSARDEEVVHRWYQGETLRQSVRLPVGANRTRGYRTYSQLTVDAGSWRVEVRSANGTLLHQQRFAVQ